MLTIQNDQISYSKHILAPFHLFFKLFMVCFGAGRGWLPRGLGHNLLMQFTSLKSSKNGDLVRVGVFSFDLSNFCDFLCGWAAVHVDDISIAGSDSLTSSVLQALRSVFSVGSENREEYLFCGVHLECKRDDDGNLIEITLDQQKYIDEITEISLEESTYRGRLLNAKETTLHRGLIGALSWCTGQTRPDFSYSVCRLSQRSSKPTVSHALQANKTLQHMTKRSLFIRFPKLNGRVRLIGNHDSSWGNGEEGKTVGGWLWTIASIGEDNERAILYHQLEKPYLAHSRQVLLCVMAMPFLPLL